MNHKIKSKPAQRIINRIIRQYRPKKIIMFGSYARGDIHQGSDLDLVIIKNTKEKFLKRMDRILDLCDGKIAVEPLIYTEAEFEKMLKEGNDFLETVVSEGKVVYER
ncbi:MAG: nucleotidyltransferase domain-containing protein [Candidatus Zixiibacteriota bacterium]